MGRKNHRPIGLLWIIPLQYEEEKFIWIPYKPVWSPITIGSAPKRQTTKLDMMNRKFVRMIVCRIRMDVGEYMSWSTLGS